MPKPLVYGAPWCPYCVTLLKKLDSMGVEYDHKNVDDDGVREEMNAKTENNQTIPVLFVGEEYWVNPDFKVLQEQFQKQGAQNERT